jgi:hypothetical protein
LERRHVSRCIWCLHLENTTTIMHVNMHNKKLLIKTNFVFFPIDSSKIWTKNLEFIKCSRNCTYSKRLWNKLRHRCSSLKKWILYFH